MWLRRPASRELADATPRNEVKPLRNVRVEQDAATKFRFPRERASDARSAETPMDA